jgi:hypothetical protein
MVVGNIDNHLSRKVLEKTNTEYIDIIESTPRNTAAAIALPHLPLIRRYFDYYAIRPLLTIWKPMKGNPRSG